MRLSMRQVVALECTVCRQLMWEERRREGVQLQALVGSVNYGICCGCYQTVDPSDMDAQYKRRWTLRMKTKTRNMISRDQLARMAVVNHKRMPQVVNDGGVRKRWVGIGWLNDAEQPPKPTDPIVVDDMPSGKRWQGLL